MFCFIYCNGRLVVHGVKSGSVVDIPLTVLTIRAPLVLKKCVEGGDFYIK